MSVDPGLVCCYSDNGVSCCPKCGGDLEIVELETLTFRCSLCGAMGQLTVNKAGCKMKPIWNVRVKNGFMGNKE
jgi:hypothetical protein